MVSITIDPVDKVFPNGFHAIHELSLSVEDGEFLVLVEPSGCGKSTALRMVAGLEEVSIGALQIGDRRRGLFVWAQNRRCRPMLELDHQPSRGR